MNNHGIGLSAVLAQIRAWTQGGDTNIDTKHKNSHDTDTAWQLSLPSGINMLLILVAIDYFQVIDGLS